MTTLGKLTKPTLVWLTFVSGILGFTYYAFLEVFPYERELEPPFAKSKGHSYHLALPLPEALPFTSYQPDGGDPLNTSRLVVLEDGIPLAQPHALHREIRSIGGGRYSHWKTNLYFSSIDGTSPNTNDKQYTAVFRPNIDPTLILLSLALLIASAALSQWGSRYISTVYKLAFTRQIVGKSERAAVILALLVFAIYSIGNVESIPPSADARQNLNLGLVLSQEGVYGMSPNEYGYHRREPTLPILIAIADRAYQFLGLPRANFECAYYEPSRTDDCRKQYQSYKAVLVILHALTSFVAFLFIFQVTGIRFLAYATTSWIAMDMSLIAHTQSFLTELPAAFFMTISTFFLVNSLTKPSQKRAVFLGLSLALLTLSKVVFAFAIVFVAILLALSYWSQGALNRDRWINIGTVLMVYGVIVGGYMVRNYVQADSFSIVEARSYKVLSVRSAYNEMTHEEFKAGFIYYLPTSNLPRERPKDAPSTHPKFDDYIRFDTTYEDGFRRTGQKWYRDLYDTARKEIGDDAAMQMTRQKAMEKILADPWQHLKVSVLLAYRGIFLSQGFGHRPKPRAQILSKQWDWPFADVWPRFSMVFSKTERAVINLVSFTALLLLPFVWFVGKNFAWPAVALLALYSHGVYAVTSHFIPRYAIPELPIRYIALAISIYLIVIGFRHMYRQHFSLKPS